MATAALDLNDAALTLASQGRILAVEPGLAAAPGALGAAAKTATGLVSNRHWRELGDALLPRPLGAWRTAADMVQAHLRQLQGRLPADCRALVAAVPSCWTTTQLGLFLGIAADLGLPLAGLVDSAVAASRRPAPGRDLWHLELTLHDAGLTRILQEDGAVRDTTERFDWFSIQALERACVRSISAAFLRSCRFDPLHDAGSECQVYEQLPGWLAALRDREHIDCVISFHGSEFHAGLAAAGLRTAVLQAAERMLQRLRMMVPAPGGAVLQVPDRCADYPGLLEALARLSGWEIVTLEPGAAALGALRLVPATGTGAGLVLVTRLPWDRPALPDGRPPAVDRMVTVAAAAPTHICFGHQIFRLGSQPFRVGSELAAGEYGLQLPAALQGLSRRHCSFTVEGNRVLVHDHSRYGTRLNGVPVEGPAVLQAGDRIEIGQPPVALQLLSEEGRDGTAA